MFMTQPAASIQLKKLQDQFEIPLIEIIKRRIHITEFGMEIYRMADKILGEVYAINYRTEAFKGLLSGRLSIGVVSTGKYVMPYFLSDFMKKNGALELQMDVTNKSKVIASLENGDIDFALVSIVPDRLDVHEEILLDNVLQFVANKNFQWNKKKLSKKELEEYSLIFREEGSATRSVMENYFEEKNLKARKKIELTSNEAVKQAVLAGLGISIMPIIGIREEIKAKRLKIVPAAGLPIKTKWRLIWLKNRALPPAAEAYLSYLRKEKERISRESFS